MQDVAMLSAFTGFQRGQTRWQDRGLCVGDDTNTWFPEPPHSRESKAHERYARDVSFAVTICNVCPVKDLCLADAESRNETLGIWGGKDFYVSKHAQYRQKAS